MIKAQCLSFLSTPPLWKKEELLVQQFEFPPINLSTFQANSIPVNIRLGHQIEYVFKQLLEHSEVYQIVLHNLQVKEREITIGEIDFILKDKIIGKLIHVELTYKFYLIDPEISDPIHRLIGPNKRDNFVSKLEKIKYKQFPLLHSEQGTKVLQNLKLNHSEIGQQSCFKAQLFRPFSKSEIDIKPLNKKCVVGYWLKIADFNQDYFAKAEFYMPTKSEWVIMPNNQVDWKKHSEIKIEINQFLIKEKSPMIWMKKSSTEFEKLFVVWW